jgi:hypothetical protein
MVGAGKVGTNTHRGHLVEALRGEGALGGKEEGAAGEEGLGAPARAPGRLGVLQLLCACVGVIRGE